VGQGSWFCPKCLAVLAKDEHPLKETQRRVIFQQERLRKFMPIEIASQVEPREFVHYVLYGKAPDFVVTEKRMLTYDKTGVHEYPWKDVVSIGQPFNKLHQFGNYYSHHFTLVTFQGDFTFNFQSSNNAWGVYRPAVYALTNFTGGRKHIETVIMSLKFREGQ
jgi:hypothetical protein